MSLYDVVVQRWRASLPSAAVDQFLAEQGAELHAELDAAERTARDRRSIRVFQQWIDQQASAGRDFDEVQLRWLDWMRQDITARGELTLDHFGQGPYAQAGGTERATRIFGRRTLGDVVAGLNATLGWKTASCGCGCGGKCGVSAGGCGCKAPRPAPDNDAAVGPPAATRSQPSAPLRPGSAYTWHKGQPFHKPAIQLLGPDEVARARLVRTIHAGDTELGVWDLGDGRHAAQTLSLPIDGALR